jgi:radical SAM protein with 4Fe4S-binding SPASM domain
MEYCRKNGVIPNITVAEISDETADKLVKYCGAVAVSVYSNHDIAYDSVKRLTDRGMSQVNIHRLIEKNSFEDTMKLIDEVKTDERLACLNAVVFLSLKQKGRGIHFERIEDSQFEELIKKAVDSKIGFGFDSCTATKFYDVATKIGLIDKVKDMIEPCESSLFSMYTNVKGEFYPCSFAEGQGSWKTGLDVVNCNDFIEDIWNHKRTIAFRKGLICNKASNGCRQCPFYRI